MKRSRFLSAALLATMLLLWLMTATVLAADNTDDARPIDRIVAVVNDDVVTATELQARIADLKRQLQRQGTALPPPNVLQKKVLERFVLDRIQLQLAAANGVRVSDELLNKTISTIATQNKLSLSGFRELLQRDGYNFAHFRENMREEITMRRLRQRQVASRITVTQQEIANFLINQRAQGHVDDEYHLGHILIALPESATPEQIKAKRAQAQAVLEKLRLGQDFATTVAAVSDGRQALQGGDLGWRKAGELPTIFADAVQEMKTGDLSALIRSPSGFHIIKLLGHHSGKHHVIKQTHARHILIRTNALTSDEDAKKQLLALRAQALKGEDFAKLAASNSADKASAAQGGDLGWAGPGKMVPAFEEAMDKLSPGEISQPIKTPFGWHLIKLLGRRVVDDTDQFKRDQARKFIFKRKLDEAEAEWLRKLRGESYVEYRL